MIGQPRSTQRYERIIKEDEAALTADIIRLASEFGRYGYRRITALLKLYLGWCVNHKRAFSNKILIQNIEQYYFSLYLLCNYTITH